MSLQFHHLAKFISEEEKKGDKEGRKLGNQEGPSGFGRPSRSPATGFDHRAIGGSCVVAEVDRPVRIKRASKRQRRKHDHAVISMPAITKEPNARSGRQIIDVRPA